MGSRPGRGALTSQQKALEREVGWRSLARLTSEAGGHGEVISHQKKLAKQTRVEPEQQEAEKSGGTKQR